MQDLRHQHRHRREHPATDVRFRGARALKGKTQPERIYALIGDAAKAERPEFRTLADRQEAFLALYRAGSFAEALPVLQECADAAQVLAWRQGYYEMMRLRVDGLIDDSPADWNGVYVATEK
ncbi:MAG: hypothetical protein E6G95_16305 [Alphaproteobacteria bacterium]|nr:MAG: hypothetical protein E6G95_16305 [Alphaproteobacteria bacterium]